MSLSKQWLPRRFVFDRLWKLMREFATKIDQLCEKLILVTSLAESCKIQLMGSSIRWGFQRPIECFTEYTFPHIENLRLLNGILFGITSTMSVNDHLSRLWQGFTSSVVNFTKIYTLIFYGSSTSGKYSVYCLLDRCVVMIPLKAWSWPSNTITV